MAKINRTTSSLVLFLLQPFIGFLASLKNLDSRVGRFVFISFFTLWGYSQSFDYITADVYRLGASFCQYGIYDFSTIIDLFANGNAVDGYLLVSNYLIHLISDNAKVYFAWLGLVYGIVCYETLVHLIKERRNGNSKYFVYILGLLFIISSIANLAMPRFWTAAWLASLVFLKVTQGHKRWGWLSLLLPLIHFSFVPVSAILLFISWFGRFLSSVPKMLFVVVCIMFLLSFVMPKTVIWQLVPEEMIDDSPKMASKMAYVSENQSIEIVNNVSAYREANGIVTRSFQFLMKLGSFLILLYFYLRKNVLKNDNRIWITYCSVLAFAIVMYFMSIIPATGWRYINLLWLLLLIFVHRYYDIFRPQEFGRFLLPLYLINIYSISFMLYLTYRTVDLLLFYAPLPFVIIHGIGFPPVFFV